jgi:undecaprenyl diphosphate synthase
VRGVAKPVTVYKGRFMQELVKEKLPRHVAIIMDGNGRWAQQRSLDRVAGHYQGAESVRTIVRASRELGVSFLTLFAFSSENWSRPADEVRALMLLLKDYLVSEAGEMQENGIRFFAVGDFARLSDDILGTLRRTMEETSTATGMTLTLALSYGGRDDLVQAIRRMIADTQRGTLAPEAVNEETVSRYLWTAGLPDPDLLIRTSGEMRISNFFLWQLAYTEIYVTPKLWPDFGRADLIEALLDYQGRERRFGLIREQIETGD